MNWAFCSMELRRLSRQKDYTLIGNWSLVSKMEMFLDGFLLLYFSAVLLLYQKYSSFGSREKVHFLLNSQFSFNDTDRLEVHVNRILTAAIALLLYVCLFENNEGQ